MKKKIVSVVICFAICAGFILFSSGSVQAGKYIYFNEKGEQLNSLSPKHVQHNFEKKQTKVRNRLNNSDNIRSGADSSLEEDAKKNKS